MADKVDSAEKSSKKFGASSLPVRPQDWKKWKEERKAQKRKWKEERLLKKLEQQKQKEQAESEEKRRKEENEKVCEDTGRHYTVSLALPGSILDNAQTPELRTYLAGQIARAIVVFSVDEVIVFDEMGSTSKTTEGVFDGIGKKGNANVQLARILQYLECPQYLRKSFFPQHRDLQYAGLLNPLDTPHHMKVVDRSPYREGVVLNKPCKEGRGSYVNAGLRNEVQIDKHLQPGIRVTVKIENHGAEPEKKKHRGTVVAPTTPRIQLGQYWGYNVRLANSLGAVFTECPYQAGYDITIGTSEKGTSVDQFDMPKFKHLLIVFGGVKGLEFSLEADEALDVEDPSFLFNHYLNTCPGQGSHTIRTEEAVLITLSILRPKIQAVQTKPK